MEIGMEALRKICSEELKETLKQHKLWIEGGVAKGFQANLSAVDLHGTVLSNAVLIYANFSNTNLSGANLHGANLLYAKLGKANLSGANLNGTDLSDSILCEANLSEANFKGANLSGANLHGANPTGANFHSVVELPEWIKRGLDHEGIFSEKQLFEAIHGGFKNLAGSWLKSANLTNTDFFHADLAGANLSDADLSGSNLKNANLCNANLCNANLSDVDLTNANLNGADLHGVNFLGANLTNVHLRKSILESIEKKLKVQGFRVGSQDNKAKAQGDGSKTEIAVPSTPMEVSPASIKASADPVEVSPDPVEVSPVPVETPPISVEVPKEFKEYSKIEPVPPEETVDHPNHAIIRSMEFLPEYKQTAQCLFSYFGELLIQKFPNKKSKVKIEQEGSRVTMVVEMKEDEKDEIKNLLDQYGLLVGGEIEPEEMLDNPSEISLLKSELHLASARLEAQKKILGLPDVDFEHLEKILYQALMNHTEVEMPTQTSPKIVHDQDQPQTASLPLAELQGTLSALKEEVPAEFQEDLQNLKVAVSHLKNVVEKEVVAESSSMAHLRRFLKTAKDGDTTSGQLILAAKNGVDFVHELGDHYNEIAQWCGLPLVPKPFFKKKT